MKNKTRIILAGILFVLLTFILFTYSAQAATLTYNPPYTDNTFTEEDIYLLASGIYGEAGADFCSDEMRYGVGSVIYNRVRHDAFPDSVHEVLYQPGQYGCIYNHWFKEGPNENCLDIARDIIQNGTDFPPDVLYQSNQPLGHGVYLHEQNMYFCHL